MKLFCPILFCLILSLFKNIAWADTRVNVVGLFSGKAVLVINNGKPQTLSAGQLSVEGVKLVAADSNKATLEIDGKRKELAMGQAATLAGDSTAASRNSVILYADSAGHHFTEGQINGITLKFIVDTGASVVTLNSGDAQYAGIDYKSGERIRMQTADGIANGYHVVINTLKLGNLVLNQVDAVVVEGGFPTVVLLGMSALSRMQMKSEGIALTLTKKY